MLGKGRGESVSFYNRKGKREGVGWRILIRVTWRELARPVLKRP